MAVMLVGLSNSSPNCVSLPSVHGARSITPNPATRGDPPSDQLLDTCPKFGVGDEAELHNARATRAYRPVTTDGRAVTLSVMLTAPDDHHRQQDRA